MNITLEELLEAGAHFGHQVRRWNPKMAPFIYAVNEGVHIFDLAKTRDGLFDATEALRKVVSEGGTILFVGTKRQGKELVEEAAKKVGMPYVTTRWLGGLLTNFEQMKKTLRKLEDMKKAREAGEHDSYTKHERLLIDREIASMERVFGGIATLTKLPDMVFVLDTHEEKTAVREAVTVGVPVVGVVDTNGDPDPIDYIIPANDDAVKSISLIMNKVVEAIQEVQRKTEAGSEKSTVKKAKKEKAEAVEAQAA